MMASAKRKQDERNLKILRELVSQPGNKECFDCHQRGPTYVNMTIGSFVCTSCSGMLRGLTPPHRVKSISMATFTQEEIDFIREHGNEYCKKIWLGLMSHNSPQSFDIKDEQQMKDLMTAKYELKRYYLEPSIANENQHAQESVRPTEFLKEASGVQRVPHFGTTTVAINSGQNANNEGSKNTNEFVADFKADFSKTPDPFVSTALPGVTPKFGVSPSPQPFFANFDNNFAFNAQKNIGIQVQHQQVYGNIRAVSNKNGGNVPPSEDRYAALKDLDSLMKQTHLKDEKTSVLNQPTWNTNNTSCSLSGMKNETSAMSNPFVSPDLWKPSANIVNNNLQSVDNSLCNTANPFRTMQFGVNNDSQWIGIGSSNNGDGIQFSQFPTPLSSKVYQSNVSTYHVNPFMVDSGMSSMTRTSNNPFL